MTILLMFLVDVEWLFASLPMEFLFFLSFCFVCLLILINHFADQVSKIKNGDALGY